MENQTLFSSKDKSNKLKRRLLQFVFGALRVNFKTTNTSYRLVHRTHNAHNRVMKPSPHILSFALMAS